MSVTESLPRLPSLSLCVITFLLSIYLPRTSASLAHTTSSPTSLLCFLSGCTCPPSLRPTLPSLLSILSGRGLPGVNHLSLLTWPLTGLPAEEKSCWEAAGKHNSVFCHDDISGRSADLRDLVRNERVVKYKQASVDYNIARCGEDCERITQINNFKFGF